MLKPPNTVKMVMHAVCLLLNKQPTYVPSPDNPKIKIPDYWESSKKLLKDKHFIPSLLDYDINALETKTVDNIRKNFISNKKEFNPERVNKASNAAKGLCEWVLALDKYEIVLTQVRPLQEDYDKAQSEVKALRANLKEKQQELNKLSKALAELQDRYDQTKKKQNELEADIDLCEKKLIRAETLINSLGGEKIRWTEAAEELEKKIKFIVGDVMLSAGTISYLGAFDSVYRTKIQKEWVGVVKKNELAVSEHYSLENTVGEPILLRKWTINGLPSDAFSRENGIIIDKSNRYSLMIDP
mmetsp:Transcript_28687/g.25684  ORF Transcript_28687/g.25684 Transcript_28687/m.25684 type:complete len:299 (-) Transcript_28687:3145-4041(-)